MTEPEDSLDPFFKLFWTELFVSCKVLSDTIRIRAFNVSRILGTTAKHMLWYSCGANDGFYCLNFSDFIYVFIQGNKSSNSLAKYSQQPGLYQTKVRRLEFNLNWPHRWQGPKYQALELLPAASQMAAARRWIRSRTGNPPRPSIWDVGFQAVSLKLCQALALASAF